MIDSETEHIELYGSEDSESEKENNNKEKDDKVPTNLLVPKFDNSLSILEIQHSENNGSIDHPEIITPPPESFIFIS